MPKCPGCGLQALSAREACLRCGRPFAEVGQGAPSSPQPSPPVGQVPGAGGQPRKSAPAFFLAGAICLAATLALGVHSSSNRINPTDAVTAKIVSPGAPSRSSGSATSAAWPTGSSPSTTPPPARCS